MNASAQRHPLLDLLARYRAIFKAAWAARRELAGPARLADEAAFLPAALSLQETPAHPAPRRAAWAICALFVLALTWAIVGRVDIVAVAAGRIVVSDRTKTLQPLEASVVKRVLVKDGDVVQAGQVLVELDATNANADGASVQEQLDAAISEESRTAALLEALRTHRLTHSHPSTGSGRTGGGEPIRTGGEESVRPELPPSIRSEIPPSVRPEPVEGPPLSLSKRDTTPRDQALLQAEWQDIQAKLAKLSAEQAHRQAEITTAHEAVAKLEATLPLARQREADFKSLTEQGFMSTHAGQDRTRERIEQERDLAMQQARLSEAQAALTESEHARAAYLAETQRTLSDRNAQAASKHEQLVQERNKTEQRTRLTHLTAPVSGTVQQVAVHTEGGVVTPAQVLMIVVPKDAQVTAEVTIDNKDIGFVNAGQLAAIKLETFPFTRYGTVSATVSSVTADAVNDEKRGAIFPATLALQTDHILVDGKAIHLSPGMNVTAEIKTGRRRVIEYLLSPVQTALSQSLGER